MKKLFIVQLTLLLSLMASVQTYAMKTDANIVGHVLSTDGHVPFINVILKGTTIGTLTDESGHFMLSNLPVGEQTIVVRGVGYKTIEKKVMLRKGMTQELNFEIKPDMIDMEGVVITGSQFETSRKETPVVVNVINPRIFEATQAVNVADGLSFTPGLRIENNCNNCGFAQLRMNGLDGPYSQILINSRPIFSALAGVYGLEQIPAAMVDRIEVVRGGGSALYGGNAIAGTVNIITKDPISNSFQLNNNTAFINGEVADISTNFNTALVTDDYKSGVFLFGVNRTRDPWDANGDGYSEIFKLKNNSFGFMAYHKPTDRSRISLDFFNLNEYRRGGNKFDLLPHYADIAEAVKSDLKSLNLQYEWLSKNNKHKYAFYTSGQYLERDSYYGAEQDLNAYGYTTETSMASGFQYVGHLPKFLFAPATITAGTEYSFNDLMDSKLGETENVIIEDHKVDNGGIYAQSQWSIKKVKLNIGGRADKNELLDEIVFSPRANILFPVIKDLTARLSYSQGFRAPQVFNEDLHIEMSGAKAVRHTNGVNLKKETSYSYSGSLDYYITKSNFQAYLLLEGFYTTLKDPFVHEYIASDTEEGVVYHIRRNGTQANVGGVNLEAKFAPGKKLNFQLGFTVQASKYVNGEVIWAPESGNPDSTVVSDEIMRTPKNYGYFVATYDFTKRLNLSATGTYTGSMKVPHMVDAESEYTILEDSPSFLDLSCKIGWDIPLSANTKLQLNGGVQNIFNSYQKDFDTGITRDAGYVYGPLNPRTFFIGLKLSNI